MPFNFSGSMKSNVAKLGVVFDGDTFTTDGNNGHTVSSTLASHTVFVKNPVRSATGVWSVGLKDVVNEFMLIDVKTVLSSGTYITCQLNPVTVVNSLPVLNWTFNVAGTPTDLPAGAKFEVFVCYSESSGN